MDLTWTDLPDACRKIDLSGRLDIEGASAIDLKLTTLTATEQTFSIIDLSGIDFLASLGIATLVRNAKAARQRGGRMILLNPRPNVAKVLAVTQIDQVIPVCYSTPNGSALESESPSVA